MIGFIRNVLQYLLSIVGVETTESNYSNLEDQDHVVNTLWSWSLFGFALLKVRCVNCHLEITSIDQHHIQYLFASRPCVRGFGGLGAGSAQVSVQMKTRVLHMTPNCLADRRCHKPEWVLTSAPAQIWVDKIRMVLSVDVVKKFIYNMSASEHFVVSSNTLISCAHCGWKDEPLVGYLDGGPMVIRQHSSEHLGGLVLLSPRHCHEPWEPRLRPVGFVGSASSVMRQHYSFSLLFPVSWFSEDYHSTPVPAGFARPTFDLPSIGKFVRTVASTVNDKGEDTPTPVPFNVLDPGYSHRSLAFDRVHTPLRLNLEQVIVRKNAKSKPHHFLITLLSILCDDHLKFYTANRHIGRLHACEPNNDNNDDVFIAIGEYKDWFVGYEAGPLMIPGFYPKRIGQRSMTSPPLWTYRQNSANNCRNSVIVLLFLHCSDLATYLIPPESVVFNSFAYNEPTIMNRDFGTHIMYYGEASVQPNWRLAPSSWCACSMPIPNHLCTPPGQNTSPWNKVVPATIVKLVAQILRPRKVRGAVYTDGESCYQILGSFPDGFQEVLVYHPSRCPNPQVVFMWMFGGLPYRHTLMDFFGKKKILNVRVRTLPCAAEAIRLYFTTE